MWQFDQQPLITARRGTGVTIVVIACVRFLVTCVIRYTIVYGNLKDYQIPSLVYAKWKKVFDATQFDTIGTPLLFGNWFISCYICSNVYVNLFRPTPLSSSLVTQIQLRLCKTDIVCQKDEFWITTQNNYTYLIIVFIHWHFYTSTYVPFIWDGHLYWLGFFNLRV